MWDAQGTGVQRGPRERRLRGAGSPRIEIPTKDWIRLAVARIERQRMPERREMHPYLVRSPGARPAVAEGERAESLERRNVGTRGNTLPGARHPHRSATAGRERVLAPPLRGEIPPHQREVDLLGAPRLECGVQGTMSLRAESEEHDPGRVAIEAVHGERAGGD